jgi:hypothetical protein
MDITIFVCDTSDKADSAVGALRALNYAPAQISKQQANGLLYDAQQWSNGAQDQFMAPKWVVIGRK